VKVAISLPDTLFREAEKAARRMRVPRSQFYARAVEVYLRQARGQDVTERLNAVYPDPPQEPDPFPAAAARAAFRRARW
jgi:hypothetical protein